MPFLVQSVEGVHPATGDRYPILSLIDDDDVDLYFITYAAPVLGSPSTEVLRIRNVRVRDTPGKKNVEWRFGLSSYDPTTLISNADGWVEIRINGRIYLNGDDFATINPLSPSPACGLGTRNLDMHNVSGWQVGRHLVDLYCRCLYQSETAAYCYGNPLLGIPGSTGGGQTCPPPGPGGSSFSGSPVGSRRVAAGGVPAVYVQPTGEGLHATAADVVDPQTLSAITAPLVSCDLTFCDASVRSIAKLPITRAGAPASDARVVRWGDVPYPWSDRFGALAAQTWELDLGDGDGFIRGLLDSGVNRFYKRWQGHLYIEDDAQRLLGTARRSIARGRCVSPRIDVDQVVTLVMSDEFSRHDSPYSLDRNAPHVTIENIFSSHTTGAGLVATMDPPEELDDVMAPILYGEGDEYRAASNPPVTPIGIDTLHYVGDFQIGSRLMHGYLVCLYASHSIAALFGSSLHPQCPASIRLNQSVLDQYFLIPGYGSWSASFATNYLDLTTNGVTYRVTMIFGSGPISQAHVDGQVPLSANVNGIESVGDCSGDLIDDGAYQVLHFLDQVVFQRRLTGNWGAIATFPDGVPLLKTSDFQAVKAIHDTRLNGRYRLAFRLNRAQSARQTLADMLVSADMRIGINHHGQIVAATRDLLATLTNLVTFTDAQHIRDGSFRITGEINAELENSLAAEGGPEPSSGRVTVPMRTFTSPASVTSWGDVFKAQTLTFQGLYRRNVLTDVVSQRLLMTEDGITRGELVVDLAGGDLAGGQLFRVTHFAGLGTTGWYQRLLMVTSRMLHVDDDDLSTTTHWEDQQQGFVAPLGMVGGGGVSNGTTTSRFGFQPIGTTAGNNGWVVGTTAGNNGWLVP